MNRTHLGEKALKNAGFSALRVFYYQLTLGPAHMARIRALDDEPGVRCAGVELASQERTRHYRLSPEEQSAVHTLTEGVYEDLPFRRRLMTAIQHFRSERPDVLILDSPADPVQYLLGRFAQFSGARVFTRWAATLTDHPPIRLERVPETGDLQGLESLPRNRSARPRIPEHVRRSRLKRFDFAGIQSMRSRSRPHCVNDPRSPEPKRFSLLGDS